MNIDVNFIGSKGRRVPFPMEAWRRHTSECSAPRSARRSVPSVGKTSPVAKTRCRSSLTPTTPILATCEEYSTQRKFLAGGVARCLCVHVVVSGALRIVSCDDVIFFVKYDAGRETFPHSFDAPRGSWPGKITVVSEAHHLQQTGGTVTAEPSTTRFTKNLTQTEPFDPKIISSPEQYSAPYYLSVCLHETPDG